MKFKPGMLGLCIVVLSLFGTVLAGFCLDVTPIEKQVTNYDYVTDVTGLFDISNAPEYIDYSPSTNYVGYSYNTVNYTETGINQYRFVKNPGTTTTQSYTVTYNDDYTIDTSFFALNTYGAVATINWLGPNYPMGPTDTFPGIEQPHNIVVSQQSSNPFYVKISKFSQIINNLNIPSTSFSASISITNNAVGGETYPVIIITKSMVWSMATGGNEVNYYNIQLSSGGSVNNTDVARLDYIVPTGLIKAYDSGNNLLWENSADDVYFINHYSSSRGGNYSTATCSTTFNATITSAPTYGYMNPADGVTIRTSPATWSNGYNNHEITLTISKNGTSANNLVIMAGSSWVSLNRTAGGSLSATVHGTGPNQTKTIGNWDSAQVRLDPNTGVVAITPIIGTASFINTVAEDGTTVFFDNWYNSGDVSSLIFSSTGASFVFGVTNTKVFLNTYGVVMNDPSFNVNTHFPDMTAWRLNFYSFATLGQSMTINGQTFEVTGGRITVSNGSDSISGVLTDVNVSKDLDGHIWFGFRDGKSIDLGEAVNDTISFGGLWYFTTGLYEAYASTEEYYDWNLDSLWHATGEQTLIISLGLLIFGVIIARGLLKLPLKGLDWLAVLGGCVLSFIVGGMLI